MSEASAELSISSLEADDEFVSSATAWARYWSRMLDLIIWTTIAGFVSRAIPYYIFKVVRCYRWKR